MSAGVACSGAHHKLLHGSGVAFCHKLQVHVNKIQGADQGSNSELDNLDKLPELT